MPSKKKKHKVSKRDADYARRSSKDKDILGCFKKRQKNGIPVTESRIANIPVRLARRYRMALAANGDTGRRAFLQFMEQYASVVEKKFNIHLDPEFPEGYDPTH